MIKRGTYKFFEGYWDNVSTKAQNLVKSLLVVKPEERLSATQGEYSIGNTFSPVFINIVKFCFAGAPLSLSIALQKSWFRAERPSLQRRSLGSSQKAIQENFVVGKLRSAVAKVIAVNTVKRSSILNNAAGIESAIDC